MLGKSERRQPKGKNGGRRKKEIDRKRRNRKSSENGKTKGKVR